MSWDQAKLDDYRKRIEERVIDYCNDPDADDSEESRTTRVCGEILGFWMYELDKCKIPGRNRVAERDQRIADLETALGAAVPRLAHLFECNAAHGVFRCSCGIQEIVDSARTALEAKPDGGKP